MHATTHNSTATARNPLYAAVMRPLCVAAIAAALGLPSAQAGDFFLKIDGIDGEVADDKAKHEKWISVDALFQAGETSPTREGRRAATLGEVSISKSIDLASPQIDAAARKGKVFSKVEISGTATNGSGDSTREPYFQWELKNVQISSYQSDPTGGPGAEALTLGGFTAGNLVEYQYDGSGQPSGRLVESFRVDPLTGAPDYDFQPQSFRVARVGGKMHLEDVSVEVVGTPNVIDADTDGDGLPDRVTLSALGSTGLDGYEIATVAHEMSHNLEMRHGDPNNDAHVTASWTYKKKGEAGKAQGSVDAGWKIEEGDSITRKKRELKVDYRDLGASQYEYVIQSGDEIVAQGVASDIDALVLEGVACDGGGPHCDPMTASEEVTFNFATIKWTYSKLDRGVLPDGEEIELDPAIATSVSLRPVGGEPIEGALTSTQLTFANFESVDVLGVSAVPEPGALVLTTIAAAVAASGRRGRSGRRTAAG